MTVPADRISGFFFLMFGLGMYFLVNPNYIESVDGGNLDPDSLPNVVSIVLAVCGALLAFKPTPHIANDLRNVAVTGIYVSLLAASIYAMSLFGFEIVAPIMALAIMLLIGERRLLWLFLGSVGMPVLIWFLVIHALGRALP